MALKVPEANRITKGVQASTEGDGNNGCFLIKFIKGKFKYFGFAKVSDGEGWEHVSVSVIDLRGHNLGRSPDWDEMCSIKNIFWDEEDVVVQYHPRKSEYISMHPFVLHLWRKVDYEFPTPDPIDGRYKSPKDYRAMIGNWTYEQLMSIYAVTFPELFEFLEVTVNRGIAPCGICSKQCGVILHDGSCFICPQCGVMSPARYVELYNKFDAREKVEKTRSYLYNIVLHRSNKISILK